MHTEEVRSFKNCAIFAYKIVVAEINKNLFSVVINARGERVVTGRPVVQLRLIRISRLILRLIHAALGYYQNRSRGFRLTQNYQNQTNSSRYLSPEIPSSIPYGFQNKLIIYLTRRASRRPSFAAKRSGRRAAMRTLDRERERSRQNSRRVL